MIVVLGCGKAKNGCPVPLEAWKRYEGQLFQAHYRLARALHPRAIYVASAKLGLIGIDDEIDDYDLTLRDLNKDERETWAKGIAEQVDAVAEPRELVIVLSGRDYSAWREHAKARTTDMLGGMTLGERRRVIGALLDAERELELRDRETTRERLAARAEWLRANDPEFVEAERRSAELVEKIRAMGSPYADKPKPQEPKQGDLFGCA